eukprot:TRINITY_DN59747_c0_g1_i1.p1 TRINITY_DN59747_c0_g1~~TRINITY_DN59747_c0_g1_i1.p1  ORF type:complete len:517 (+),score=30.70 TRINITY_DN59747_c0_g1_i1:45-1553(+)
MAESPPNLEKATDKQKARAPAVVAGASHRFHYGWVMLIACMVAWGASAAGHSFSLAPFLDQWIEDLEVPRSTISSFWTLAMLVSAAVSPVSGSLIDRFGARWTLLCCGPIAAATALWLGMLSSQTELALAITINRVFAADMLTLLSATTLNRWFVRWRGRASLVLGIMMAWLLEFPAVEMKMYSMTDSRRGAYTIVAGYVACLTVVALLIWRDSPESVGLLPDLAYADLQEDDSLPLQEVSTPVASPESSKAAVMPAHHRPEEISLTRAEAVRTLIFWAVNLMQLSSSVLWVACHFNMLDLLMSRGLESDAVASFYNTVSSTRLVVSTLLSVFVVDRLGRRTYLLLAAAAPWQVLIILMLLGTIGPQVWPDWMAVLFGFVYGLWGGINSSVGNVVYAQLFGRKHVGSISGLAKGISLAAGGLGPLFFSAVRELTGSYAWALKPMLVCSMLSATALCCAPQPEPRPEAEDATTPKPTSRLAVAVGRSRAYEHLPKSSQSTQAA